MKTKNDFVVKTQWMPPIVWSLLMQCEFDATNCEQNSTQPENKNKFYKCAYTTKTCLNKPNSELKSILVDADISYSVGIEFGSTKRNER